MHLCCAKEEVQHGPHFVLEVHESIDLTGNGPPMLLAELNGLEERDVCGLFAQQQWLVLDAVADFRVSILWHRRG